MNGARARRRRLRGGAARRAGAEDEAERLRLYYVAMTRAQERLIVSGAVDPAAGCRDARRRSAGCSAGSSSATSCAPADGPVEMERAAARVAPARRPGVGRHVCRRRWAQRGRGARSRAARALRARWRTCALPAAPRLHELVTRAGAAAPSRAAAVLQRARALRALLVPLLRRARGRHAAARRRRRRRRRAALRPALHATEIGDAAHRLLELVDLADPRAPDARGRPRLVSARRATRSSSGSARFVERTARRRSRGAWPGSPARRPEVPFAFEHDGVLLHGRLDVLHVDGGRALVLDYKTNALGELSPAEVVEARVPAAAARLRARLPPGRRRGGRGRLQVPRAARRARRRRRSRATTCRRSRRRCPRRSRGSTRATSGRPRASSPAPAAQRSTSSAPARACPARRRARRRSPRPASVRVMRVAALYDVHGNLPALEAVLAEVEREASTRSSRRRPRARGRCRPSASTRCSARRRRALPALATASATSSSEHDRTSARGATSSSTTSARAFVAWPARRADVDGLGRRPLLPRLRRGSDEEILTRPRRTTSSPRRSQASHADVVVCGHTHIQYDRRIGGTRLVNAGSVGLPYEGDAGGVLGAARARTSSCAAPRTTSTRAVERLRATGYPGRERASCASRCSSRPSRDEVIAHFER